MPNNGQRQKILYIVTQGCWGGAQKYVCDLATHFKEKYEVAVVSGTQSDQLARQLAKAGIRHIGVPRLVRSVHPFYDLMVIYDLYRLIKNEAPDVVHLNSSKAGVVGSIAAKIAGAPKIVFTIHGLVLNEPMWWGKKAVYCLAEKISSVFQDRLIAVSKADYEAVLRYRLKSPNHLQLIPNGLDFLKTARLPSGEVRRLIGGALGVSLENKIIVGSIADFYATKGLRFLVEAAEKIAPARESVVFLLIGRPGPELESIQKMILGKKLGATIFPITTLTENAAACLPAFDIFVLPSIKEGLPYTILEAAATKLPIVATKVGGIPDVLEDERSAMLVPPGDSGALAEAINRMLTNPEFAQSIAAEAEKKAKEFSLEKTLQLTENLYL